MRDCGETLLTTANELIRLIKARGDRWMAASCRQSDMTAEQHECAHKGGHTPTVLRFVQPILSNGSKQ
jgi:hypothetical protein